MLKDSKEITIIGTSITDVNSQEDWSMSLHCTRYRRFKLKQWLVTGTFAVSVKTHMMMKIKILIICKSLVYVQILC